jgi:translation initiation factor RLI1
MKIEDIILKFKEGLTVELYKKVLADKSIDGTHQQNYVQHVAWLLRKDVKDIFNKGLAPHPIIPNDANTANILVFKQPSKNH